MVKTVTTSKVTEKGEEAKTTTIVKKKFTVAANGKKVPAPGTIVKPSALPVKKAAAVKAKETSPTVKAKNVP